MEVATAEAVPAKGVGSHTIADLLPRAARAHGSRRAVLYKDAAGTWVPRTFTEVGETVRSLSLGLVDLGIEAGDKVAILANTRPEWTYFDFAALSAGAVVVPIYQTNSADECQYVLEHSDAKAVVVEDVEQLEKIRAIRDRCPLLEHAILMEGEAEDALSADRVAARGEVRPASEWEARWQGIGPDDLCTIIYTSGTTGPPKGCMISHGNYRSMLDMVNSVRVTDDDDVT